MAFTSARPISVDGVRLDTLAWNIERIERRTAARRSGDYDSPTLDGVVPSLNDPLEASSLGLQMWLRGTDADGSVPVAGSLDMLRANLDELLHLFGQRHRLLEVTEQIGAGVAATNQGLNTSLETNATHWTTSTAQFTGERAAAVDAVDGAWVFRSTNIASATSGGFIMQVQTGANRVRALPGQATGVRFMARASTTRTLNVRLRSYNGTTAGASTGYVTQAVTIGPDWSEVTVSAPLPAASDGFAVIAVSATPSEWQIGDWVEVDAFLPWVDVDPGTYFNGSTPTDATYSYAWTGTAHASTSTRTPRAARRALAKVTDSIQPELNTPGSAGVFTVALNIPSGMWEDAAPLDWTLAAPVTAAEVTTLVGATERINDAIFTVTGPANTPRITDPATGMWVELGMNLPAGTTWRFNSATWASMSGTTLTLGSADTDGTDRAGVTSVGGPSRGYGLPLTPVRDSGGRRVRATLTAASGTTSATALGIRARRKYAA